MHSVVVRNRSNSARAAWVEYLISRFVKSDRPIQVLALRSIGPSSSTRSPPIGGTRRNSAALYLKISADILCVITSGDFALNSDRIIRLRRLDPLYPLLRSIHLHFAAD